MALSQLGGWCTNFRVLQALRSICKMTPKDAALRWRAHSTTIWRQPHGGDHGCRLADAASCGCRRRRVSAPAFEWKVP